MTLFDQNSLQNVVEEDFVPLKKNCCMTQESLCAFDSQIKGRKLRTKVTVT